VAQRSLKAIKDRYTKTKKEQKKKEKEQREAEEEQAKKDLVVEEEEKPVNGAFSCFPFSSRKPLVLPPVDGHVRVQPSSLY
jgi:hypothetical protein